VYKTECRNHILRNYCSKIRDIAKIPRTDINIRNFLRNSILKFRTAIVSAIKYRKQENCPINVRIDNLKKNILNDPAHIFDDHTDCALYLCKKKGQSNSTFSRFLNSSLALPFTQALNRVASLSSSLLYDVDNNNSAESYNSVVNKFVGGKRINFSLKGSYLGRCVAAAISYNNKGIFVHKMLSKICGHVGGYTEKFSTHKSKMKTKAKSIKKKCRIHSADSHYGKTDENKVDSTISDLPLEEYEQRKNIFLSNLEKCDIKLIHEKTVNQNSDDEWRQERSIRLTASNFGRICRMKDNTNTANTVTNILRVRESNEKLPLAIQYGIDNENIAKEKFKTTVGVEVFSCGLFVDEEIRFLGASPDGL
jgi:hypothetical protein